MPEMRIAVCDDEEYFRKDLEHMITVYENEAGHEFTLDALENAADLLDMIKIENKDYDMVFLDVDMPKLSGIEAAKELRRMGKDMVLCFVTSFDDYALDAYGVDAVSYIVKPIQYPALKKIMEKAEMHFWYHKSMEQAERHYLEINIRHKSTLIDLDNVIYIEKKRTQCVFHCTDGELVCYETLKNICDRLDHDIFMQIHRGCIASYPHIKEVLSDRVLFDSGAEAPLSRRYYEAIQRRHMDKARRIMTGRQKRL